VSEQADVSPWYRGLSMLVHPSHAEAFSLTLIEGLASGCCVVSSRLPYAEQIIEDGRTGFLFAPGRADELRAILDGLMRDPARVAAVGAAAAEDARARFGVDKEAERLFAIYRDLAETTR
jgi:mannosyltransferase